ncbi:hypothetical protein KP509_19G032300 [Ceratopteris richardii]|uniref:Uncharacterized protein n=1 Tax=Ceratopteris richardii TaxID=49495 RepID=A0A8T2SL22_CERRI|nr:hypothetical protein KP509_19G032300 [Ceratopteris richardii]
MFWKERRQHPLHIRYIKHLPSDSHNILQQPGLMRPRGQLLCFQSRDRTMLQFKAGYV